MPAGKPHSFLGARRRARVGGLWAAPRVALYPVSLSGGACLPAPTLFRGLRTLALYTFAAKQPVNLGEDPRPVRPGAETGRPGGEALARECSDRGPARPPSLASPAHPGPSTLPLIPAPRRSGLLHTSPQGPPAIPERAAPGHPGDVRRRAVLVK